MVMHPFLQDPVDLVGREIHVCLRHPEKENYLDDGKIIRFTRSPFSPGGP
jgi:hypothetical protein